MDANCSQCHRPGGSGPTIDARWDTPLTNQNIINVLPVKGDLGYDNAKIVTPKDILRSVLYDRANSVDPAIKMPTLARNVIDTNAMTVIAAWINSLPGTPALLPPLINPAGGTFNGSVTVTLAPPDTNATVRYTLDGSLPTTNSFLYLSPFAVTNSLMLRANAYESGSNNSVAATAVFTILPPVFFTGPGAFTNGGFQVQLSGTTGKTYILQATTDFINWTPVATNVPVASPFSLIDPNATNLPVRFYRVWQQ
jgi:hypothetical protein